ncbi:lytic transglycosylase domain-containing protein [Brevibacillus laterosporus]|uniref:Soluble lytic murein transglycosylase n=1 Tax=Brevibacillus laterosporus LMG 15441 TaxID=1042163 RepID=A0A075R241_BRELA|nr:lytic transglycosylase domain-containing protein [Brevibacillus laterosporus]AIG25268.1 soluble lytic murein transglycosylase precursor [Brevibacillus laterosporus LMG 15441]RJL10515.1 lytic transglycosylase domain-containing protein [Brevibacillus laterosporus]TPH14944.1 lytic transglycosylase domain-containing protein [Brevibacillus laterosporus]HAS01819.1 lytic transglycosylase domain-containing protein [Brevibacillus sp.]
MKTLRSAILLFSVLIIIYLLLNSSIVWKLMYPIKYEEQIRLVSKKYEVNPYLVLAVIRSESKFKPDLVSKKGAVGLMQLMPNTAEWIQSQGKLEMLYPADLEHPATNINLGTWYLAYLLQMFKGNEVLALAAYNAGQGNVKNWLHNKQWEGTRETISNIPFGETRHYVQRVLYYEDRYKEVYENSFPNLAP